MFKALLSPPVSKLLIKSVPIAFTIILIACQADTSPGDGYSEGPDLSENHIQKLFFASLESGHRSADIRNPASIKTVAQLFSKYKWKRNSGKKLAPSYKIIITAHDHKEIVYWLGAFSDLNEPPCYRLCSGWWLASSDIRGKMNNKRYKSLSTSGQMLQLALLLDTIENEPVNIHSK